MRRHHLMTNGCHLICFASVFIAVAWSRKRTSRKESCKLPVCSLRWFSKSFNFEYRFEQSFQLQQYCRLMGAIWLVSKRSICFLQWMYSSSTFSNVGDSQCFHWHTGFDTFSQFFSRPTCDSSNIQLVSRFFQSLTLRFQHLYCFCRLARDLYQFAFGLIVVPGAFTSVLLSATAVRLSIVPR